MSAQAYLSRGVSPTKDDVKKAVKKQDKGLFPGAFCKIIEDIAGDEEYCMAVHADGAGTKSSVAYLMFKETGDPGWFSGIAQDSLVMNTDDLAAIGATDEFYLSNTIGRNAHRITADCLKNIIDGYDFAIKNLSRYGIRVIMTGGETADVGDLLKTVIADSTIVTRLKRIDVIDASNIRAGDVIVGLASFGKSVYEDRENSGIGSNGLTAARHTLLSHVYLDKYPESVSETIPADKIYSGKHLLDDRLLDSEMTVGEAILSPTRTYLPVLREIFGKVGKEAIHGIIHCTGGGQVKCKDFGNKIRYVKNSLFPRPPVFTAIAGSGQVPENEMYQIFNMGHRMEIYCGRESAEDIISISSMLGVDARIIGHTENSGSDDNQVIIRDNGNEFMY